VNDIGLNSAANLTHLARTRVRRNSERWFFGSMAAAMALAVFGGFAPQYFLANHYHAPPLPPLIHVHALIFTSWILLYLTQTTLIAAKRTDIHRKLGIAGGALGLLVIVIGISVAIASARLHLHSPAVPYSPPPLDFLLIPITDILMFAVLITAGLYNRRKPDTHKRLMLLTTLSLLPAAFGRLAFPGHVLGFLSPPSGFLFGLLCTPAFIVACLISDWLTLRRVHRALVYGGTFILVVEIGRTLELLGFGTSAWRSIAAWMVS
jgi:hypothetical protein